MTNQFLFKFYIIFRCHDTKNNNKFWGHTSSNLDKGSYQSRNFDTLKWSGENLLNLLCHFLNYKSVFLQNLYNSSVSWKTPLYFVAQAYVLCSSSLCTLVTRSQLKHKCFRLSSARVKIREVLHVNFKTANQFLFNFCSIVMTHDSSVNFKLIHFLLWAKGSHQSSNLTHSSALMKICLIPHVILHHSSVSWKITTLYFFRSNIKYFAQ